MNPIIEGHKRYFEGCPRCEAVGRATTSCCYDLDQVTAQRDALEKLVLEERMKLEDGLLRLRELSDERDALTVQRDEAWLAIATLESRLEESMDTLIAAHFIPRLLAGLSVRVPVPAERAAKVDAIRERVHKGMLLRCAG